MTTLLGVLVIVLLIAVLGALAGLLVAIKRRDALDRPAAPDPRRPTPRAGRLAGQSGAETRGEASAVPEPTSGTLGTTSAAGHPERASVSAPTTFAAARGGHSGIGADAVPDAAASAEAEAEAMLGADAEQGIRPVDPTGSLEEQRPRTLAELERVRRTVLDDAAAIRLQADRAAASTKSEADNLAGIAKRLAEAEAAATRRTAEKELEDARRGFGAEAARTRQQAELEASAIALDARRQADREIAALTENARTVAADAERRERRAAEREERAEDAQQDLAERQAELAENERDLAGREDDLAARTYEHEQALERVAGLTAADAKAELIAELEEEVRRESALVVRDAEAATRATAQSRARNIVAEAIQRVASEQTAETVVSVMHLPSDELKGRIIGREGRNIRAFESVTGVNLIIDDTPEAVLLSCFDPVRREVGRLTLEKLIADGRIHPQRIEESYERSVEEIDRLCHRAGEDAVLAAGIGELHPELVETLGRLRYRTSYGQNVLAHLVECAHIAGIMAAELGLDPKVLKRGAFLHDIGKAFTHEVQGSHALIGADFARKHGEHEDVVHAIEAHHNEVPPQTVEAVLTQAADACSGGRPGARRESLEAYVKRLERIEEIAASRPGVDRVFAMQAGREIRVMVAPDRVDDVSAALLAREVAKQIESELTYPGQIRVTVVRESRATEIAH